MHPKITASVTCFNLQSKVTETIKSIINQTYTNLEILVVDDGSTDNSLVAIREIAATDPRIKVISQKNGGAAAARNTILEQATGEYIHFADGDDRLHPLMLEELIKLILKEEAEISICRLLRTREEEIPLSETQVNVKPVLNITGKEAVDKLVTTNAYGFGPCNKLFKMSLFDNIRFPEGRSFEDAAILYRLYHAASKVVVTNAALYFYIQHATSLTNHLNSFSIRRLDVLINFKECYTFLVEERYSSSIINVFSSGHFLCIRWMLIDLEQHPDKDLKKIVIQQIRQHFIDFQKAFLFNKQISLKEKFYLISFMLMPQTVSRLLRSRNTKIYKKNLKEHSCNKGI
ncbi:glycosyltransferase family 2 protein [Alkalicoccus luteus]|uniref:Glycosyltransferase family 2 protein n=1 Tax=Alkalicoccus luteus TaxID=1237094 RepID=A0A969TY27_9BACI|nr:glycosyltransferase family 2 protein [Alkalicoccus luteus]NJP38784.1 glycosyltransferase family 2 protein [Alkalicoccus luteus]